MMTRSSWIAVLLCLGCLATTAWADDVPDAAALHARGAALLAEARFEAALEQFVAAAAAAPDQAAYVQDAAVLRRVIALRKVAETPEASARWERTAATLHAFYLRHRLHEEAEALDRRALATLKSAVAEARLAETLLEADRPTEVAQLLAAPAPWTRTVQHTIYRGLALARMRQYDAALQLADGLSLPADADPLRLREAARLEALLGRADTCAALLVRAFRATPTTALEAFKAQVLGCADFAGVRVSPAFVQALATPSAQKAASCSGGTDCGSCPSRGGCGKK